MKIICAKNDLLTSINIVLKAVPAKTTTDILECILIKAENGTIKLVSNDMEMGIETVVKGKIEEEGITAINAKIFSEIVRKLPDNDVKITVGSDYVANIVCEKSKFNIASRDGIQFPALPSIKKDNSIELSEFSLRDIIRQTVFSISDNETNIIMTGEYFDINGNKMRVAALDGHRIAIRNIELKQQYGSYHVIVPGKALIEISKILTGEMDNIVKIYFSEKHIMFELEDTIIVSRLIEGRYYDINRMISEDYETKVTVNNKELISCVDRALLLAKESDKKPVTVDITDQGIELKMKTQIGSLDEEILAEKEGKDIYLGLNPKYFMDVLRVIDDEKIDIYFVNTKTPCGIRDKEGKYIYLILPINIG